MVKRRSILMDRGRLASDNRGGRRCQTRTMRRGNRSYLRLLHFNESIVPVPIAQCNVSDYRKRNKSSFSTSFVKLSTQFYAEDNAVTKAFASFYKYTEAK